MIEIMTRGRTEPVNQAKDISRNYQETMAYVAQLAALQGRSPEDVRVVAVSKLHPAAAVRILAEHGHRDFGENYVQEALHKQDELARWGLRWHFLGRLQRNKAKFVPGNFSTLHSLDNRDLAWELHKKCLKKVLVLKVFLQVNLGREPQKGGVLPDDLPELADAVLQMPGLALHGLMTLPPFEMNLDEKQRAFAELRKLRDALERRFGIQLDELSMGTTDDFPRAIAEGATMVRIGTRLFGPRTT